MPGSRDHLLNFGTP